MIGAELSLYSGKLRSYLIQKGIAFVERGSSPFEFVWTAKRRTHARAVPILITPEGEWLQDTSEIIDRLEQRFPERPVLPATPVLRFAAFLFELWGDEFWLPLAMHARWSHAENLPLFVHDAGDALLPAWPRWAKNLIGRNHARLMHALARAVGVTPEFAPLIDRFAQIQLDALDTHFAKHRFLFGDRASLGDFGLIGPLYAHLGRDPWPRRELIGPRPHLGAWIKRMFEPGASSGSFLAHDSVPPTLTPCLRSIVDEMLPFLDACAARVRSTPIVAADAPAAIRMLPEVTYPFAGGVHRRPGLSYPVWMAQRLLDSWRAAPLADRQAVRQWLDALGGGELLQLDLPRVRRIGLAAGRVI
ncbi:MAG: glutathione S-transferase [Burkholderiales bacterium]|nr:glutathione S-transferase [Burkholderiales bacterium]